MKERKRENRMTGFVKRVEEREEEMHEGYDEVSTSDSPEEGNHGHITSGDFRHQNDEPHRPFLHNSSSSSAPPLYPLSSFRRQKKKKVNTTRSSSLASSRKRFFRVVSGKKNVLFSLSSLVQIASGILFLAVFLAFAKIHLSRMKECLSSSSGGVRTPLENASSGEASSLPSSRRPPRLHGTAPGLVRRKLPSSSSPSSSWLSSPGDEEENEETDSKPGRWFIGMRRPNKRAREKKEGLLPTTRRRRLTSSSKHQSYHFNEESIPRLPYAYSPSADPPFSSSFSDSPASSSSSASACIELGELDISEDEDDIFDTSSSSSFTSRLKDKIVSFERDVRVVSLFLLSSVGLLTGIYLTVISIDFNSTPASFFSPFLVCISALGILLSWMKTGQTKTMLSFLQAGKKKTRKRDSRPRRSSGRGGRIRESFSSISGLREAWKAYYKKLVAEYADLAASARSADKSIVSNEQRLFLNPPHPDNPDEDDLVDAHAFDTLRIQVSDSEDETGNFSDENGSKEEPQRDHLEEERLSSFSFSSAGKEDEDQQREEEGVSMKPQIPAMV